jgi:ribonuclease-3
MKCREAKGLEEALGHKFRRSELLQEAITHSSYAREQEAQTSVALRDNEQLEFLGDAVLGFVTSQELFARYPQFREGQLSKTRAYLVSESHLVRAAQELRLGEYLRLGHGEEKSGGREKPAILVDALEAVLAALYLDAGLETARAFVLRQVLEPELARLEQSGSDTFPVTDYKSALQEAAHLLGRRQPAYVLVKERGPEHKKTFTVEARLHSESGNKAEYVARGEGMTKKQAEQCAAKEALQYLRALQAQQGEAE